jgi:hypothetical protein
MGIIESRQNRLSPQIHHFRLLAGQSLDLGIGSHGYEFSILDGHGFRNGEILIHGDDFAIEKDGIGMQHTQIGPTAACQKSKQDKSQTARQPVSV